MNIPYTGPDYLRDYFGWSMPAGKSEKKASKEHEEIRKESPQEKKSKKLMAQINNGYKVFVHDLHAQGVKSLDIQNAINELKDILDTVKKEDAITIAAIKQQILRLKDVRLLLKSYEEFHEKLEDVEDVSLHKKTSKSKINYDDVELDEDMRKILDDLKHQFRNAGKERHKDLFRKVRDWKEQARASGDKRGQKMAEKFAKEIREDIYKFWSKQDEDSTKRDDVFHMPPVRPPEEPVKSEKDLSAEELLRRHNDLTREKMDLERLLQYQKALAESKGATTDERELRDIDAKLAAVRAHIALLRKEREGRTDDGAAFSTASSGKTAEDAALRDRLQAKHDEVLTSIIRISNEKKATQHRIRELHRKFSGNAWMDQSELTQANAHLKRIIKEEEMLALQFEDLKKKLGK